MKPLGRLGLLVIVAVVMLPTMGGAGSSMEAPKWVAALFVEAQRAVGLRWMPVSGATGYRVLRSETKGKDHKEIATVAQAQYFDTKIEAGATYHYLLQATAGSETSGNSEEKTVTIPGQKPMIASPTLSKVILQESTEFGKTSYKIGIKIDPVPGAIAYNVYRSTTPGKDYQLITSTPETVAVDTQTEYGKTYYYVTTALDKAFNESRYSQEHAVSVAVASAKKMKQAPSASPALRGWSGASGDAPVQAPGEEAPVDEVWVIQKLPAAGPVPPAPASVVLPAPAAASPAPPLPQTVYLEEAPKRISKMRLRVSPRGTEPLWAKQKGDENGKFNLREPFDLSLDEAADALYLVSNHTREVYVLRASSGELLRSWGSEGTGPGQFLEPLGTGLDKDGNLFVADKKAGRVVSFTPQGIPRRDYPLIAPETVQISGPPQPLDVAVDWETGDLYVSDGNLRRIWVLDKAGKFKRFIGTTDAGQGDVARYTYLRFNREGELVAADPERTRILTFKRDGTLVRSWGERKSHPGAFVAMGGFGIDAEGNYAVVDKSSSSVQEFLPDGRYLTHLANQKGDAGIAIFSPKDIVIDSKNRAYICEGLVDRIQAFQITGPALRARLDAPDPVESQTPPRQQAQQYQPPPPKSVPPAPLRAPVPAPVPVFYGDTPGTGELRAIFPDRKLVPLPLAHTEVAAAINGYIATVTVAQRYQNPYDAKIEAVYVFPLPENGAVTDFLMVIGERRIRGIIRERAEAERIYQEAKRQGYVASLLTQERPNIFTQKVANIEPGKQIEIEITYFNTLVYSEGEYSFVFPMVVGPRYNPAGSTDGVGAVGRGSAGASGQKTEVQYLRPEERSGHDIMVTVDIDAGVEIEMVNSNSHAIAVEKKGKSAARVKLAPADTLPNKDFVLHYRVAGKSVRNALLVERDKKGGYFTLMLQPPANLEDLPASGQEMVFVMDTSGSMNGWPITKAKAAMRHALKKLTPEDTFQIVCFANGFSQFAPAPVPATPESIDAGIAWLDQFKGGGGTEMLTGIRAALDFPHDERRLRVVSFMTDGYVGNEEQIIRAVAEKLGPARIFSFGIGNSVNRFLIEGLARLGQGAAAYVLTGDSDTAAVDLFYDRIRHPALTDITIDWGGMEAGEIYPKVIPDLMVGRPVIVTGRFQARGDTIVRVTGRTGGERQTIVVPVSLDEPEGRRRGIARIWARSRISELMDRIATGGAGALASEVKETALAYSLVSAYTAFVAVDSAARTAGEHGTTVNVPVPVPDGVRYETTVQE